MNAALAAVLGYALGSIPWGLLLTRAAGLGDIRRVGSGNIGATNVLRTGRKGLAAATLLLDALKAVAAVLLARALWAGLPFTAIAAVAAVAGHVFPLWLRFRGGKGVASGLGALLALLWPAGVAACVAWLAVAAATRISSAGSLAACAAGVAAAFLAGPAACGAAALGIAALVMARHHGNIRRLLAGTEPRIGRSG